MTAIARRPLPAALLAVPASLATEPGPSLGVREARVARARNTPPGWLFRAIEFLGRGGRPRARPLPVPFGTRPEPGPYLDREIDRALALLAGMPFEELQKRGWNVQPHHYYWPLNDVGFLRKNPALWARPKPPVGVAIDLDEQQRLVERLSRHAPELADVGYGPAAPGEFVLDNGRFTGGDIFSYYGLVRELQPARVIEIGTGASSLLLGRALAHNERDCAVTLIEPYPDPVLLGSLPSEWRCIDHLLQHVDLTVFEELEAGDVLFYDGSHVSHTASDVNWMLFEVLPRLAAGVWVHFHDIQWPNDYPVDWLLDEGLSWNEQYILHAFLMHNTKYRLRLAVNMLWTDRETRIAELLPNSVSGGSVWIEKVAEG